MKKQKFHYAISGYRWAPGSFRASKGLAGQSPQNIPLTAEERHEVGLLFLSKGFEAAVGYVKHIERAQERQRRSMITYGFCLKEGSKQFVYCPQLYCRSDASIEEKLRLFKKIRSILNKNNGRIEISTQCELDGEYRPINIKENTVTADFSRPLRIPMGNAIIRCGPEPPYRPWVRDPKKSQARKHRKPTRTR